MGVQSDSMKVIERQLTLFLRRVESARRTMALDRSAYLLLGELDAKGPQGISVLAEMFHLDISTASRQTAALEAKGLVERLSDSTDGRVSLLRITDLGQKLFHTTHEERLAQYAALLDDWSEEDRRQFGQYLTRFNHSLERNRRVPLPGSPPTHTASHQGS